jgi:hypothetical protein
MDTNIVRSQSPEEKELDKKRLELSKLEDTLAERELELTTLQNRLQVFEHRYLLSVGVLYAELDALESEIAELELSLHPQDQRLEQRFEKLRVDARESAREANRGEKAQAHADFQPSENLKKLYREAAKRIHPDLARDNDDAARRHKVMAEVNCAYETSDESRLQTLLDDWDSRPDAEEVDDIGIRLIRLIRRIAQLEDHIHKTEKRIAEVQRSSMLALLEKEVALKAECRNMMSEMASNINAQIATRRQVLAEMKEVRNSS